MEFNLFSILELALGIWVLLSPCWCLVCLQNGDLQQPLLEAGGRSDINNFLLSWFTLSVSGSVHWAWFFWIGHTSAEYQGTLVWSDFSDYLCIMIISTVITNTTLLFRLSINVPRKTLLFLSAWVTSFCIISLLVLLFKASTQVYITGFIGLALTVSSNICRVLSSERPQYSTVAMSVALAGVVAGILWMPKSYAFDRCSKDVLRFGFSNVFFKKNFFWKLSSTVGSLIRIRDAVILVILAGGFANVIHEAMRSCSWFRQKVVAVILVILSFAPHRA